MKNTNHKRYKTASFLLLAILVLKVIIQILPQTVIIAGGLPYVIISYLILVALIILAWKRVSWTKFILIIPIGIVLYNFPAFLEELKHPTTIVIIEAAQFLFLIAALIVLFWPQKSINTK